MAEAYSTFLAIVVKPKIIPKILEATRGLLLKKDKIGLIKWADFLDTLARSSAPLKV